jgi:cyclophilin family peptidyl-prolyl cis-trans isomerase
MRNAFITILCALSLSFTCHAAAKPKKTEKNPVSNSAPEVKLQTTLGDIVIKLDSAKAPVSVENFLAYVKAGHYDGTIFHRVIPGFMAQGGGFTEKWDQKPTKARTSEPQSATAQFFINYADNAFLDFKNPTPQGWGYAVFGEVVQGMDIVDKMATVPTGRGGPMPTDVPQTPIVITKATVVEAK